MPILPSATVAHGRDQVGKLDVAVPDQLLSMRDRDDWEYYAGCLPPARLIAKFAEALDQFHALIEPARHRTSSLTRSEKGLLLSKWNAAAVMASQVTERFAFEHKSGTYGSYLGDGVSQGLYFLDIFLRGMGDRSVPAWQGRQTYYNDLDPVIMERIKNENFARINAERNSVKYPSSNQNAAPISRNCWKPPQL